MTMLVRSVCLCVLLMITTLSFSVHAQDGKNDAAKGEKKKQEAGESSAANSLQPTKTKQEDAAAMTNGLGSFGQMLPLGRKNLNVQIPSFRNGAPSSLVKANSMTRISDTIMSMESMDIWLYGNHRDEDMRVQLPLADYDLESKVLSSEERSRISRNDFQLEGDRLIFDTVTQQGKMTGRVQMVIFNAGSFAKPQTEDKKIDTQSDSDKPDQDRSSSPSATQTSAQGTSSSPK